MNNTQYYILISGLYGSGKSLVSSMITEILNSKEEFNGKSHIQPFAFYVKEIATTQFGWDGQKNEAGRRLLQQIGAIGREYNQDIWVKKAYETCLLSSIFENKDIFLFDDWRFENEFYYIKNKLNPDNVIKKIRLFRDIERDENVLSHESERGLPDDPSWYDYSIQNKYTDLQVMREEIENLIVNDIFKKS